MVRTRIRRASAVVVIAMLGTGMAQAQNASYDKEQATRVCVQKRLTDLITQNNRNVVGDAALNACAIALKGEMKEKGKSDCDVEDYVGWVIMSENNKINQVTVQPYKPNSTFLSRCRNRAR